MRNKWFQYGLSLAIVSFAVYTPDRAQDVVAQGVVQNKGAFESEIDDLKI